MVLNKNNLISQNKPSFTETRVIGTENILWNFYVDQTIFLDFTGIGSLENKEIWAIGAKLAKWEHTHLNISVSVAEWFRALD